MRARDNLDDVTVCKLPNLKVLPSLEKYAVFDNVAIDKLFSYTVKRYLSCQKGGKKSTKINK